MHKIKYGRAPFDIEGKRFFAHANFCWNHQKNGVEILVQRMSKDSFWWYVKSTAQIILKMEFVLPKIIWLQLKKHYLK